VSTCVAERDRRGRLARDHTPAHDDAQPPARVRSTVDDSATIAGSSRIEPMVIHMRELTHVE
jgi:hypothetical protein